MTRRSNGEGTIRPRGERYTARVKVGGDTKYATFDTERAARSWIAAEVTDARRAEERARLGITADEAPPARPPIRFADLASALVLARTEEAGRRERRWSDGMVSWFLGHVNSTLAPEFGEDLVHEITPERISTWLNGQIGRPILHRFGPKKGQPTGRVVRASSLKHYERALAMAFKFAVENGPDEASRWLERSPMDRVRRTHVPRGAPKRALRAGEVLAILNAAAAREREAQDDLARAIAEGRKHRRALELAAADTRRDRAYVTLLALTGLRRGEAARMRWSWVTLEDRMLWVRKAKIGDELPSQELPLSRRAAAALRELGARRPHDLVFPGWTRTEGARSRRGTEQELTSMVRPLRRLLELAKVDPAGVGLHTFRHTFSTLLARAATPAHVQQQLMRHTAGTMTARYTHAEVEEQREALERLELLVFSPVRLVELPAPAPAAKSGA